MHICSLLYTVTIFLQRYDYSTRTFKQVIQLHGIIFFSTGIRHLPQVFPTQKI